MLHQQEAKTPIGTPAAAHRETSHPSAAESSVLHRPSGASMEAAASMAMVAGSRVSSAAVSRPRRQRSLRSMSHIIDAPDSDDEQAVSMLRAGPARAEHSCEGLSSFKIV